MKKTFILTFALLLAFVVSHAQTEKGTQTIGVNLQYLHSDQGGYSVYPGNNSVTNVGFKYTNFTIGPLYSYFIANNLDLGASLSYQNDQYSYPDNSNTSLTKSSGEVFGGSIFLRKYFMYKNIIGLRVGPMFGYSHGTASEIYQPEDAAFDEHSKSDFYNVGYGPSWSITQQNTSDFRPCWPIWDTATRKPTTAARVVRLIKILT